MTWFHLLTFGGWLGVILAASLLRGRPFAIAAGVLMGIYSLLALAMAPYGLPLMPAFTALHVAVYVNFAALAYPRMRPLVYRLLVSWPASFFVAGTLLALPWALARSFGSHPWAPWLPYALGAVGLLQSLTGREEEIDLVIGGPPETTSVLPHAHGSAREERPLRIVQITDPHLGPFMSVERLRRVAARAVSKQPDLILLTGDFLTMESQSDPDLLRRALEPLRAMPGRVFACYGNHDHEARATVTRALAENGVTLLVDEERVVLTEAGPVQIVGMDFVRRDRHAHLQRVCAEHPRRPGVMRAPPRSGRVPAPARGRRGSRPVGPHAWRASGPGEPGALVDVPASLRPPHPGPRVLGARARPHVRPQGDGALRVPPAPRSAVGGELPQGAPGGAGVRGCSSAVARAMLHAIR
jgi:hypothetical protein